VHGAQEVPARADLDMRVEGERRLENRLQEEGYFFAEVMPICTVTPPLAVASDDLASADDINLGACAALNPEDLSNRNVQVVYEVEPGRRFKLTDIRIEGTNKITVEDIEDDLRTTEANALGFIPLVGLGRGFTSNEALAQDRRMIEARMRDLGYRRAVVTERQGVSPEGENLIITFVVEEGKLTRLAGIEVRGNQIFTAERLREAACPVDRLPDELCNIVDAPFSRSTARAEADRIRSFYARNGYLDADAELTLLTYRKKTATSRCGSFTPSKKRIKFSSIASSSTATSSPKETPSRNPFRFVKAKFCAPKTLPRVSASFMRPTLSGKLSFVRKPQAKPLLVSSGATSSLTWKKRSVT